jgi:hypothetical protein
MWLTTDREAKGSREPWFPGCSFSLQSSQACVGQFASAAWLEAVPLTALKSQRKVTVGEGQERSQVFCLI